MGSKLVFWTVSMLVFERVFELVCSMDFSLASTLARRLGGRKLSGKVLWKV